MGSRSALPSPLSCSCAIRRCPSATSTGPSRSVRSSRALSERAACSCSARAPSRHRPPAGPSQLAAASLCRFRLPDTRLALSRTGCCARSGMDRLLRCWFAHSLVPAAVKAATVQIEAEIVGPVVALDVPFLDFGLVKLGTTLTRTITFRNFSEACERSRLRLASRSADPDCMERAHRR